MAQTLASRADYLAAQSRLNAARSGAVIERLDGRHESNLQLTLGYTGYSRRLNTKDAIEDVFDDFEGPNALLTFVTTWPFSGNRYSGKELVANATVRRAELERDDVARQVRSDVEKYERLLAEAWVGVKDRESAVRHLRLLAQDATRRFQLGLGAAYEMVLLEEDLTEYNLALINEKADYMKLMVCYEFETGTLLKTHGISSVLETRYRD